MSVEINPPNSLRRVSDMLWYLYHENVALFRDGSGDWSVVFETRCRNLKDDLRCGVYEERPIICRDFDDTSCEVNDPEGALDIRSPEELLAFLKVKRPRLHRKLMEKYVPGSLRGQAPP